MKTKRAILCLLALILIAGGLWLKDWLTIDRCLDQGGGWNSLHNACEFHR